MYDVLIIGCGVTGAAAAFELSKYRLKVGILERENDVALLRIQGACRLIQQKKLWSCGHCPGDCYPLLLPPG